MKTVEEDCLLGSQILFGGAAVKTVSAALEVPAEAGGTAIVETKKLSSIRLLSSGREK